MTQVSINVWDPDIQQLEVSFSLSIAELDAMSTALERLGDEMEVALVSAELASGKEIVAGFTSLQTISTARIKVQAARHVADVYSRQAMDDLKEVIS